MIVVCGEALIDLVPSGNGTVRQTPGGGPFNTARALARLGVSTAFLSHLSNDPLGCMLLDRLAADDVDLSLTTCGPEPTTLAVAQLDGDGLATYSFAPDGTSAPNLTADMVPRALGADVSALHVGTLGLVLEPMATTLTELTQREATRRLVMLDPNVRPALVVDTGRYRQRVQFLMAQSTIVKVSDEDLEWLFPGLDREAAADRIISAGARLVVVTLGGQGAFGVMSHVRACVPAPTVDVVDTIGAGDAFGAALLAWLHDHEALRRNLVLDSHELEAALAFACLAASITCTRAGAEPPCRAELAPGRSELACDAT